MSVNCAKYLKLITFGGYSRVGGSVDDITIHYKIIISRVYVRAELLVHVRELSNLVVSSSFKRFSRLDCQFKNCVEHWNKYSFIISSYQTPGFICFICLESSVQNQMQYPWQNWCLVWGPRHENSWCNEEPGKILRISYLSLTEHHSNFGPYRWSTDWVSYIHTLNWAKVVRCQPADWVGHWICPTLFSNKVLSQGVGSLEFPHFRPKLWKSVETGALMWTLRDKLFHLDPAHWFCVFLREADALHEPHSIASATSILVHWSQSFQLYCAADEREHRTCQDFLKCIREAIAHL